jgi:hypothetical protein
VKKLVDHPGAVEQWALRAQRSERNEKEYGAFFEDLIRPDLLLHVTYGGLKPPGRKTAVRQLRELMREVEIAAGRSIAWVAALDYGRTGRLHFHILAGNVDDLSRKKLFEAARRKFGRVTIVPFEPGRGGAEYVARNGLSDLGDFEFGGRLLENRSERIAAARGKKS